MMNKQETFNTVYNGLKSQDFKKSGGDSCYYRNGNLKCAFGHLIPDEEYHPDIEGYSVYSFKELMDGYFTEGLSPEQVKFVQWFSRQNFDVEFTGRLQQIHDRSNSAFDMKERLIAMALNNNLEVPND